MKKIFMYKLGNLLNGMSSIIREFVGLTRRKPEDQERVWHSFLAHQLIRICAK